MACQGAGLQPAAAVGREGGEGDTWRVSSTVLLRGLLAAAAACAGWRDTDDTRDETRRHAKTASGMASGTARTSPSSPVTRATCSPIR